MAGAPLIGKRVIVTRAADRSSSLADKVRATGAEVIEVPLTVTVDAPDGGAAFTSALDRIENYDWVVVTSPEGARRMRAGLSRRLDALGLDALDGRRFAAVGTATAEALCGGDDPVRGVRVHLVPAVQTGAGLGAEFPIGPGRILLAVARDAGTDFEEAARAKGWTVDRVTSYATEPVQPVLDAERRAVIESGDAVIFAASSAVRSWVEAFGALMPPVVVAMGPRTARTLEEAGQHNCITATEQSLGGVVAALVSALTGE